MKKTISRTVRDTLDEKFLVRADGDEVQNIKFIITHDRPNTASKVQICIFAFDRAQINVDATTIIENSAPNTNAWLEIRVITRGSAVVNAAPNLKIRHSAVKAGHALTTKHVSDDELFYLMSRGLPREAAEKLVIDAFIEPFLNAKNVLK
ncbi:SufD family Fe-S cluster assembly protein [Candidatus Saccharibacteria bacterium]|nr:SufD family Fe-S cluster assembly protein [Candidatus Saccharibacteria bacterium]MCL1962956.1 SufD family Fe-S cluster assembly protein [Candidatus Saccharibacteria bacterium]